MVRAAILAAALVVPGIAGAEQAMVCKGEITSIQGEGLVARTHRFEVPELAGADVQEILEKTKKIASEKQGKAFRKNASLRFRKNAEVNLECRKGEEQFQVKRSIPVPN